MTTKNTSRKSLKRITTSKEKLDIITKLTSDQLGVFSEIWRLLIFSAKIGIKLGKKVPLKSPSSNNAIRQEIFQNTSVWPGLVYLICLAETGDSSMFINDGDGDNRRITLFEEYANGGLEVLDAYFSENTVNLDNLLTFIQRNALENDKETFNEADLSI